MNRRYVPLAFALVAGCVMGGLLLMGAGGLPVAQANNTYFNLAGGSLTQDWSNGSLFTADNNWGAVPSIIGYDGADAAGVQGSNPCTLTAAPLGAQQVSINRQHPSTLLDVGVAHFITGAGSEVSSAVVGLRGQTAFDAPSLVIHLNATGRSSVNVKFDAVDIDHSGSNALSAVAVQWRAGSSGAWATVHCIPDATEGPSIKGKVTAVNVTLPASADNQAQLQVRIMTYNAAADVNQGYTSADEWVGIDNLNISSAAGPGPTQPPPTPNPNLNIKLYLPLISN